MSSADVGHELSRPAAWGASEVQASDPMAPEVAGGLSFSTEPPEKPQS